MQRPRGVQCTLTDEHHGHISRLSWHSYTSRLVHTPCTLCSQTVALMSLCPSLWSHSGSWSHTCSLNKAHCHTVHPEAAFHLVSLPEQIQIKPLIWDVSEITERLVSPMLTSTCNITTLIPLQLSTFLACLSSHFLSASLTFTVQ